MYCELEKKVADLFVELAYAERLSPKKQIWLNNNWPEVLKTTIPQSLHTSAHLGTAYEILSEGIEKLRKGEKSPWQKRLYVDSVIKGGQPIRLKDRFCFIINNRTTYTAKKKKINFARRKDVIIDHIGGNHFPPELRILANNLSLYRQLWFFANKINHNLLNPLMNSLRLQEVVLKELVNRLSKPETKFFKKISMLAERIGVVQFFSLNQVEVSKELNLTKEEVSSFRSQIRNKLKALLVSQEWIVPNRT